MNTLVLQPTDMSQWHALVNEAQCASQLMLAENTESYLVFMLMRFCRKPKLVESVIALDFYQAQGKSKRRQIDILKDMGDKSLLFCGLFPGLASRRHLSIRYYADMGRSAYYSLSDLVQQEDNVFYHLGHRFNDLQTILTHMRHKM